jgi:hypothetical protein
MTLDDHLAHLLWLMETHPEGWKAHCWHRAKELARSPDLAELPTLLEKAMLERSKKFTPQQPSTEPPMSTNGALTSTTSSASK